MTFGGSIVLYIVIISGIERSIISKIFYKKNKTRLEVVIAKVSNIIAHMYIDLVHLIDTGFQYLAAFLLDYVHTILHIHSKELFPAN